MENDVQCNEYYTITHFLEKHKFSFIHVTFASAAGTSLYGYELSV